MHDPPISKADPVRYQNGPRTHARPASTSVGECAPHCPVLKECWCQNLHAIHHLVTMRRTGYERCDDAPRSSPILVKWHTRCRGTTELPVPGLRLRMLLHGQAQIEP